MTKAEREIYEIIVKGKYSDSANEKLERVRQILVKAFQEEIATENMDSSKKAIVAAIKRYLRQIYNAKGDSKFKHIYVDDVGNMYFGNRFIIFQIPSCSEVAKALIQSPPSKYTICTSAKADPYSHDYESFMRSVKLLFDGRNVPNRKSVEMYSNVKDTLKALHLSAQEVPSIKYYWQGKILSGQFNYEFDARMMVAIHEILGVDNIAFYADEGLPRPCVCMHPTKTMGVVTVLFTPFLRPEDRERFKKCEEEMGTHGKEVLDRLNSGTPAKPKKRGLVRRKPIDDKDIPF